MTNSTSSRLLERSYPLIKLITDAFVVGFAVWTLAANLVVRLDLSFETLYSLSFLPLLAIAIWFILSRKTENTSQIKTPSATDDNFSPVARLAFAGAAALLTTAYFLPIPYAVTWLLTALFLLVSWLAHGKIRSWRPDLAPKINNYWQLGFILLAILLALAAVIFARRPDPDDSLFINIAVTAVDHPEGQLYEGDTLQNIQGGDHLPPYEVLSYELLVAAISRVTSTAPIVIAHFWLPLLAALLAGLAVARLMFLFLPKGGAIATLLVICILLLLRDTHWIYGNFAFVRIFQGKSWFVTIVVPLIITYGLEYATRPNGRRWLLLALSQVAAVGLTANALYAAPIVAGLTLCCCWQPGKDTTLRFFKGLSASFYPVLMGFLVLNAIQATDLQTEAFAGPPPVVEIEAAELGGEEDDAIDLASGAREADVFEEISGMVSNIFKADYLIYEVYFGFFGQGSSGWLWLFTLIGGWAWIQDKRLRRWVLAYSTLVVWLFLSPFWDEYLTQYVTGYNLIWRLLWTVPLPAFMALWVHQAFQGATRFRPGIRYALQIGLAILLSAVVIRTIQEDVRPLDVSAQPVFLKVPEFNYAIAEEVVQRAQQPANVLVPWGVSPWITTFEDHPYPLVARDVYVWQMYDYYKSSIDVDDLVERIVVYNYISGGRQRDNVDEQLRSIVQEYDLQLVVIPRSNPWLAEIEAILEDEGYCATKFRSYEFFEEGDFCR